MSDTGLTHADARFAARRFEARLAAVQALYQLEYGGRGADAVVREFIEHRLPEESRLEGLDQEHFERLVTQTVAAQADVDAAIAGVLAEGWSLKRIDATARAILRAGAWEVLHRADIPAGAIIDAYLAVADAFFEDAEPKFIHGALDALARQRRG